MLKGKCHRIGCKATATQGIRDKDRKILYFCAECIEYLIRAQVIDSYHRVIKAT